jgi:hypothetical protein
LTIHVETENRVVVPKVVERIGPTRFTQRLAPPLGELLRPKQERVRQLLCGVEIRDPAFGAVHEAWSACAHIHAVFANATVVATATGYVSTLSTADVESVGWQLAYIIGIASVLGVLSWNAGNKLIGVTNGVLFINFVPVTAFAIRIAQGHRFQPIEFLGAALVIGALIANNAVLRQTEAPKLTGRTEPRARAATCARRQAPRLRIAPPRSP